MTAVSFSSWEHARVEQEEVEEPASHVFAAVYATSLGSLGGLSCHCFDRLGCRSQDAWYILGKPPRLAKEVDPAVCHNLSPILNLGGGLRQGPDS